MANRTRDERPSRAYRSTTRYKAEAKALGVRIRELRKARGWTLYQTSDEMDIDLKHLQRIETGVLNITLVTLVRLAEGFGVPIGALFADVAIVQAKAGSEPIGI